MHRSGSGYESSLDAIGQFFKLAEPWYSQVRRVADDLSREGSVKVGVHIRQGDFKEHLGGQHYFTTAQYAKVMRRIGELFPEKVVFLVCSNQLQDPNEFEGLQYVNGPGHFVTDMYALAECDYIVGPGISSFSAWASLVGQKPRYGLFDPEKEITLADFQVCKKI